MLVADIADQSLKIGKELFVFVKIAAGIVNALPNHLRTLRRVDAAETL